jgi:hypothetical protein
MTRIHHAFYVREGAWTVRSEPPYFDRTVGHVEDGLLLQNSNVFEVQNNRFCRIYAQILVGNVERATGRRKLALPPNTTIIVFYK